MRLTILASLGIAAIALAGCDSKMDPIEDPTGETDADTDADIFDKVKWHDRRVHPLGHTKDQDLVSGKHIGIVGRELGESEIRRLHGYAEQELFAGTQRRDPIGRAHLVDQA